MSLRRYTAVLFLTCVALYGLLLAISFVVYPANGVGELDTARVRLYPSLFTSEPKYLLFNSRALDHHGRRVLLIGSSNVREGLRPEQLKARVGNIEIDNLALSSSNIRQVEQVVDLAYEETPRHSWPETTFVLGIWYGMFVPDGRCYPQNITNLDVERLRYGLYRRKSNGVVDPRLPKSWMPFVEEALRPVLLVEEMYQRMTAPIDLIRSALLRLIGESPVELKLTDRDSFSLSPAQREEALLFWNHYMGPVPEWDESGLPGLLKLARKITQRGSRLVILDLPLPIWHREAVPYSGEYEQRKQAFLRQAEKLPGVTYASMQDGFSDDDFFDSTHPRPRATGRWAQRAAEAILPALRSSGY